MRAFKKIDQVRDDVQDVRVQCVSYYRPGQPPQRCERPATFLLVSPDDEVISRLCQEHCEGVLQEYALVPELVGWYSVAIKYAEREA